MGGKICTNTKVTSAHGGRDHAEVETQDGLKVSNIFHYFLNIFYYFYCFLLDYFFIIFIRYFTIFNFNFFNFLLLYFVISFFISF